MSHFWRIIACLVTAAFVTKGAVAGTRLQAALDPADLKLIDRVTWGVPEAVCRTQGEFCYDIDYSRGRTK